MKTYHEQMLSRNLDQNISGMFGEKSRIQFEDQKLGEARDVANDLDGGRGRK